MTEPVVDQIPKPEAVSPIREMQQTTVVEEERVIAASAVLESARAAWDAFTKFIMPHLFTGAPSSPAEAPAPAPSRVA